MKSSLKGPPPPPQQSKSFYCIVLYSLISVFLLLSCDPDEPEDDDPPQRPSISFADGIMGMREFTLEVTASTAATVVFIATASETPPTWNNVKDHITKRTRVFTANVARPVYFSATIDLVSSNGAKVVDLSSATTSTEKGLIQSQAPGFMNAGSDYYVHAFYDGSHLGKHQITTASYPATYQPFYDRRDRTSYTNPNMRDYMWGMQMWFDSSGNNIPIEMRTGELNHFPMRYSIPLDTTAAGRSSRWASPCPTSFSIDDWYGGVVDNGVPLYSFQNLGDRLGAASNPTPTIYTSTPNYSNSLFVQASPSLPAAVASDLTTGGASSNYRTHSMDALAAIDNGQYLSTVFQCFDARLDSVFPRLKIRATWVDQ